MSKKTCSDCALLNRSKEKEQKGFFDHSYIDNYLCEGFNNYRNLNDEIADTCSKFKESSYNATGCFITTAIVNILGMEDDSEELNTLRWFRVNYMQSDECARDILVKYDAIGPIIAKMLTKVQNPQEFSRGLYNVYIKNCVKLIKKCEYDTAISLYSEMTENLIKYFGIDYLIPTYIYENYDYLNSGHGKITLYKM